MTNQNEAVSSAGKWVLNSVIYLTLLVSLSSTSKAQDAPTIALANHPEPKIAIIIDDIGYSLEYGLRMARLPGSVTLAVLPHTPNGAALAELGYRLGKEIILHTPMENERGLPLDRGGLTDEMELEDFLFTLRDDIASIPHVTGINNHMGSQLTQNITKMSWLMSELNQQSLFFVDSRTSPDSVAFAAAIEIALPSAKRDIFLDHERSEEYISQQFDELLKLAARRGHAIAIGHPYPETLAILEQRLPLLEFLGIELVPISSLLYPQPVIMPQMPMTADRATSITESASSPPLLN